MPSPWDIEFRPKAAKAFERLDPVVRKQLARKLAERRNNPRVQAAGLRELPDCYKIKLRAQGVRCVYQVQDRRLVILILAIGKRERDEAYRLAAHELATDDD